MGVFGRQLSQLWGAFARLWMVEQDDHDRPTRWYPLLRHFIVALLLVLGAVLLARRGGGAGLLGVSLLILLLGLALGGGLGFLFAIPRTAPQVEAARAAAVVSAAVAGTQPPPDPQRKGGLLTTNNNLEKVSDWLTTMLVGVGLSQLGNIDGALTRFRQLLADHAPLYGNGPDRAGVLPLIGPFLLIVGIVVGFIYFYVFTRVVIGPKLYDVEDDFQNGQIRNAAAAETIRQAAQDAVQQAAQGSTAASSAVRAMAATAVPTVNGALNVMFDALYQPGGYANAIRVGQALANSEATQRPEYWFYLAAAQGQRLAAAQGDKDREEARVDALEAARRAVSLSPAYRERLWQISDPDGFDDDLAPLRGDPQFLAIVGRANAA